MAGIQDLVAALGRYTLATQANQGGKHRVSHFETADGVEWLTWRRTFLVAAQINVWDPVRQCREIRASMKGAAERAVSDIDHEPPAALGVFTPAMLLDAYQERFLPAAESDLCRVSFRSAAQTEAETILEWHTRCRSVYLRAYPLGNVDAPECRDQFVLGLARIKVREQAWTARAQTYAAALVAAHNEAAAQAVLSQHTISHAKVKQEPGLHAFSRGAEGQGSSGCYWCGDDGHFKRDCAAWQKAIKVFDASAPAKKGRGGGGSSRGRGGRGGGRGGSRGGRGGGKGAGRSINAVDGDGTQADNEDSADDQEGGQYDEQEQGNC